MRILIDNGHGENTSGKGSPYALYRVSPAYELREWSWNRSVARMLLHELRRRGYDAELIVTETRDISLKERCRRVNAVCDAEGKENVILVSIHGNAIGDGTKWEKPNYWSVWTSRGRTKADRLADCIWARACEQFRGMKVNGDASDGDNDYESDFYILKHTKCPAVLTENFFYTSEEGVRYMLSDEGVEKIVSVHADGIEDYLKTL